MPNKLRGEDIDYIIIKVGVRLLHYLISARNASSLLAQLNTVLLHQHKESLIDIIGLQKPNHGVESHRRKVMRFDTVSIVWNKVGL